MRCSRPASMPCSPLQGLTRGLAGACLLPNAQYTVFVSYILALDGHFFDALTVRTRNGHPLRYSGTNTSICVTEADAVSVFAIGDVEYECVFPCPLSLTTTHALTSYCGTMPKTHRRTRHSHSRRCLLFSFVLGTDLIGAHRRILYGAC